MNKEQAEAIKVQIIERRNYLRALDVPLVYSKINLHGGMQNRVDRQSDREFKIKIDNQRGLMNKNLNAVNNYINKLDNNNSINKQCDSNVITMQSNGNGNSQNPFNIILPPVPQRIRPARQGIGGRR